ncbi:hypothetical protein ACN28I_16820 [Archangium gephyra]|uniref:hypothetical protein n=1 Tax=Archangium gephyra TaxID=48 RepID=UPI003B7AA193
MNRVRVMAGMLVLMIGTACPVGGEAGILRQAMLKDLANEMAQDGCQPADLQERCGDQYYDACLETCIEKMNRRDRR